MAQESKQAAHTLGSSVQMPRFTGQQMNATLSQVLPELKAARKRRAGAGRKTSYTRERFNRVLERMAAGETQREALAAESIAPSVFFNWTEKGDGTEAEAAYCRAALTRAQAMLADHAWSEALEVPKRLYEQAMAGVAAGQPCVDGPTVQAAKLLTDSLWRYAERLRPSVYADKQKELPVVTVNNNTLTISGNDLSPEQRAQLRAALTAASSPVLEG